MLWGGRREAYQITVSFHSAIFLANYIMFNLMPLTILLSTNDI